jgi:hypothetical protein
MQQFDFDTVGTAAGGGDGTTAAERASSEAAGGGVGATAAERASAVKGDARAVELGELGSRGC